MQRVSKREGDTRVTRVTRRLRYGWWLLVVIWCLWLMIVQPHVAGAWVGFGAVLLVTGVLLRI